MSNALSLNTIPKYLADVYPEYPIEVVRGHDLHLFDSKGRKFLDLYGGHAVSLVGHSNAEVIEAIARQGREMSFWSNLMPIPIRDEAAGKLLDFSRAGFSRVFFCNSGAEANENALKVAVRVSGRHRVVGFRGGFHGRTVMAASATDHPDWHAYFGPWFGPTLFLSPNDESELPLIDKTCAAVILEPIQSIGGVREFDSSYLGALRKRCDDVGALLIFDEVQTGVGRTGVPFVAKSCGVIPDMSTTAKGLANGFPIGALLLKENVASKLKKGDIAATFGGGPMALAAMMKVLEIIERDQLMQNATAIEAYVR